MSDDYTPPGSSSDSRSSLARLKRSNATLRQQLKSALSSDNFLALNNKIAEQEKVIAGLAEENRTLKNELRRAKKDIESLSDSRGDLPQQLTELTAELRNSKEKARKLQEKLEAQEKNAVAQQQRMVDLESKNRKLAEIMREAENGGSKQEQIALPVLPRDPPTKKPAIPLFPKKKAPPPLPSADSTNEREKAAEERLASAMRNSQTKKPKATPAKVPPLAFNKAQVNEDSLPLSAPVKASLDKERSPDRKPKKAVNQTNQTVRNVKINQKTAENNQIKNKSGTKNKEQEETKTDEKQGASSSVFHPPTQETLSWANLESETDRRAREDKEKIDRTREENADNEQKPFFQLDSNQNSRNPSPKHKEETSQEWFSANAESDSPTARSNNKQTAPKTETEHEDGDGYEDDFE
jgi:hypothetical protein